MIPFSSHHLLLLQLTLVHKVDESALHGVAPNVLPIKVLLVVLFQFVDRVGLTVSLN